MKKPIVIALFIALSIILFAIFKSDADILLIGVILLTTLYTYIRSIYLSSKKRAVRKFTLIFGSLSVLLIIFTFFILPELAPKDSYGSGLVMAFSAFGNSLESIVQIIIGISISVSMFWIGYLIDRIIEERHKKKRLGIFYIIIYLIPTVYTLYMFYLMFFN